MWQRSLSVLQSTSKIELAGYFNSYLSCWFHLVGMASLIIEVILPDILHMGRVKVILGSIANHQEARLWLNGGVWSSSEWFLQTFESEQPNSTSVFMHFQTFIDCLKIKCGKINFHDQFPSYVLSTSVWLVQLCWISIEGGWNAGCVCVREEQYPPAPESKDWRAV